jgi:hypothetical protein
VLLDALLEFYCVSGPGTLKYMLGLSAEKAYSEYKQQMLQCTHQWAVAASSMAAKYPGDPNIQSIAAGALMQDPAWKWWYNQSVITGALGNVSIGNNYENAKSVAIRLASGKVRPAAALANAAIENALNIQPDHLGAMHFAIHNLEQGPAPRWVESVADRLLKFSAHQGHAIHMQTHIATRIGNYNDSHNTNLLALQADADWNIARTGGGIMSLLYKYVPHNAAFAAEAAQHMGNFKKMVAAIQSLNYCAGFGMVADAKMASLGNFLTRQLLQPLRFGRYEELKLGLEDNSTSPVNGLHEDASVTILLPGQRHVLDSSNAGTGELRNSLSDVSLYVKIVSFARIGEAEQAEFYLRQLLSSPRMLRGCPLTSGSAIDRASECATHK